MRDWSPYAIGGATRPDSFTGMSPDMQSRLWDFLQAADADLGPGLQVYSGYRSPELQGQLFQNALETYGSEQEARKWVAPPGRSRHNTGEAADLKYNGVRIDRLPENHPVRIWLQENTSKFGLDRPMSWEPWQVELAGARSGSVTDVPVAQNALYEPASQPKAPVENSLAQPAPPRLAVNALDPSAFMNNIVPIPFQRFT